MDKNSGIITLATGKDYKKAIGLALSFKITNSNYPISVICHPNIAKKLAPYFDDIILKRTDVTGFAHKLYLDEYSPYEKTLFLDADMLVFGNLQYMFNHLNGNVYTARGWYLDSGKSSFGLDRKYVLNKIGKKQLVCIDGAGHAYFEKPQCYKIFEVAREIMNNYDDYFSGTMLADEDIMAIALTVCDLKPFENCNLQYTKNEFMGSPWHAQKGTLELDVLNGKCRYKDKTKGIYSPFVMHFSRRARPFLYAKELNKLNLKYGKFDLMLYYEALRDWLIVEVVWKLNKLRRVGWK